MASKELSPVDQTAYDILQLMEKPRPISERLRGTILGRAPSCELMRQMVAQAAWTDVSVLIRGASGTGKELVATALHDESGRRSRPFRALNCAAFPSDLLEAELFGVEPEFLHRGHKGQIGLWELADGGTLFLDEVGDLAPNHQTKILRAVDTGIIRRVGGSREISVDVRIVAATDRHLEGMVREGRFRMPLLARLNEISIWTPRLSDHIYDLPLIANAIWRGITEDEDAQLSDESVEYLQTRSWPDNVRGLRNALYQLYVIYQGTESSKHLEAILPRERTPAESDGPSLPMTVPVDLLDVMEILAKASHKNWMEMRKAEGWSYGLVRVETDEKKENPDLMAWEDLSDGQKSYARGEARAIVRTLLEQGYRITDSPSAPSRLD